VSPLVWAGGGVLLLLAAALVGLVWTFSGRLVARRRPDPPQTPADFGLPFEELAFSARDGIPLRGWFIPASSARVAIVLCHGHAGSMDPEVKVASWLYCAGFHVLMFDFRAHGRSGGDHVSLGTLERRDLLGALDVLSARGIDRVGVLGFSMGGAVALLTAAVEERIVAVVCDGAFAWLDETLLGWAEQRTGAPRWLARPVVGLVRRFAEWRLGVRLEDPIRWIGCIAPRPVLLIHGDRDRYVSVRAVEALYAAAGEPKELWRVAEAGHRRVDQRCPEEYRRRVVGFFERWL